MEIEKPLLFDSFVQTEKKSMKDQSIQNELLTSNTIIMKDEHMIIEYPNQPAP
jgi:hypothetical protein